MSEPKLNYVSCPDAGSGHQMAYWQWGDPTAAHMVLCVHGLTRQGRDFDTLARSLCEQAKGAIQVVCPDVAGRGRSDWLQDPSGYQVASYAADMLALLAQRQPVMLDWVGTSMGGLIGVLVAGQSGVVPIRRLVLNDVGPVLQWQAIQRIGQYLGNTGRFDSVAQAAQAMWAVSSTFGPHTPAQWLALSQHMVRPCPDASGALTLHYDPAIGVPFASITQEAAAQGEAALWHLYDAITAHTLLLRGAQSDLLSAATAQAMTQRGPKAHLVEFAGIGHAPTLVQPEQVAVVCDFLLRSQGH